jgi:hypothetical protein
MVLVVTGLVMWYPPWILIGCKVFKRKGLLPDFGAGLLLKFEGPGLSGPFLFNYSLYFTGLEVTNRQWGKWLRGIGLGDI